jgi:hypothetical protein
VQPGHALRVWPILASDEQLTVPGLVGTAIHSELWDVFSSIHFHYRQPGEVTAPPSQKELDARYDKRAAELGALTDEYGRMYALGRAAKAAVDAGHLDRAEAWTTELLELMPRHRSKPGYGNAQQDSHSVLGRLALRRGDIDSAKAHLLKSGMTDGSPSLDSFGPNMKLAQELLEKGEREIVLQYFELCRAFWAMGGKDLDTWTADVEAGRMPEFGANLVY